MLHSSSTLSSPNLPRMIATSLQEPNWSLLPRRLLLLVRVQPDQALHEVVYPAPLFAEAVVLGPNFESRAADLRGRLAKDFHLHPFQFESPRTAPQHRLDDCAIHLSRL